MNEILADRASRQSCSDAAPDSGNGEILAHYGTADQKKRFLQPLLDNEIVSAFSMTEPQGGADPKVFTTKAELKGDQLVINGQKWFSSNAHLSSFLIVMAVTDPDASPYKRMSMFIVPTETPGVNILRNLGVGTHEGEGSHAFIRYEDVNVPKDHMLGPRGGAFVVAQTRLGGGRIHHAMRTIGQVRRAFDMMCERVLSRTTQGSLLADKQMVQEKIADSWMEIEQFRLLVLRTAWKIDRYKDYLQVRKDIAAAGADAEGVSRCRGARTPSAWIAGRHQRDALRRASDSELTWGRPMAPPKFIRLPGPPGSARVQGHDRSVPTQHIRKLREAALRKYAGQIEREVSMQSATAPIHPITQGKWSVSPVAAAPGHAMAMGFAAVGANSRSRAARIDSCESTVKEIRAMGRSSAHGIHVGKWDDCTVSTMKSTRDGAARCVDQQRVVPALSVAVEHTEELFDKVMG